MDAVVFLMKFSYMCRAHNVCKGCPIKAEGIECDHEMLGENAEAIYEIVDKWVRENK